MYQIKCKPGKGARCGWCYMEYGPHRKWGGFMPFTNPLWMPGLKTLFGIECCETCYAQLATLGTTKRLDCVLGLYRFSEQSKVPAFNSSQAEIEAAIRTGAYPAENARNRASEVSRSNGPIRCCSSPQNRRLSPVDGVHLCLVSWAEDKGAKYHPKGWQKNIDIGPQDLTDLTEFPNQRGRRKPSLRGTR